jgi:retinol dehydrogenase-14
MSQSNPDPVALVTGATAGIGYHIAESLAVGGYTTLITGRDQSRGRRAVEALRERSGHDRIQFFSVDHATVAENLRLAARIAESFPRLDVQVNNVGGGPGSRQLTKDGYETILALNFVAPFALTQALLPSLRGSEYARVVNVISSAFEMWKTDPFDDLHSESHFVYIEAYARAKLLNLLWTLALARRLEDTTVTVNAVNPGMAWTPGTESLSAEQVPSWRYFMPIVRWARKRRSPEIAARVPALLATSPDFRAVSGAYFNEKTTPTKLEPRTLNRDLQERAWELGEDLIEPAPSVAS